MSQGISFARHNPTASAGTLDAKTEASVGIISCVQPLVEKNLLVDGLSGIAFARIWYALFFGQIALDGEHALSINPDNWLQTLNVLAESVIRPADTDLAFLSARRICPILRNE